MWHYAGICSHNMRLESNVIHKCLVLRGLNIVLSSSGVFALRAHGPSVVRSYPAQKAVCCSWKVHHAGERICSIGRRVQGQPLGLRQVGASECLVQSSWHRLSALSCMLSGLPGAGGSRAGARATASLPRRAMTASS